MFLKDQKKSTGGVFTFYFFENNWKSTAVGSEFNVIFIKL